MTGSSQKDKSRAERRYWHNQAMQAAYQLWPEWTKQRYGDPWVDAAQSDDRFPADYIEFILSSNWILRPEGLKAFYQILEATSKNTEITFDLDIAAFRVKCLKKEEAHLIKLAFESLREMVDEGIREGGIDKSTKLISNDQWVNQGSGFTVQERALYAASCDMSAYDYPAAMANCVERSTWVLKDGFTRKGTFTEKVFPDGLVSALERLTNSHIMKSRDGRTVYLGGQKKEQVDRAKKKLDNLARCLTLLPSHDRKVMGIMLYTEGKPVTTGEYRYLADHEHRLLRTYLLDDDVWRQRKYWDIFRAGAIVRGNPHREPWNEDASISKGLVGLVQGSGTEKRFSAFTEWSYKTKEPTATAEHAIATVASHSGVAKSDNAAESSLAPIQSHATNSATVAMSIPAETNLRAQNPKAETPRFINNSEPESVSDTADDHQARNVVLMTRSPSVNSKPATESKSVNVDQRSAVETQTSRTESHVGTKSDTIDQGTTRAQNMQTETRDLVNASAPETEVDLVGLDQVQTTAVVNHSLSAHHRQELTSTSENQDGASTGSSEPETRHAAQNGSVKDPFASLYQMSKAKIPIRPKMHSPGNVPSTHSTMRQQAGRKTNRKSQKNGMDVTKQNPPHQTRAVMTGAPAAAPMRVTKPPSSDFDPTSMKTINKSLIDLLKPLKMYPGEIVLKAELGRLCLLGIQQSKVQFVGEEDEQKHFKIDDIRREIIKKHTSEGSMAFTQVLTSIGLEANYIGRLRDDNGKEMFKATVRQTEYQVFCEAELAGGRKISFFIDINAGNLVFRIRPAYPDRKIFGVHCIQRVWDFRLVLETRQNLEAVFSNFARDLIQGLRIQWSAGDPVPELGIKVKKSYGVQVLGGRVRNIASYLRNQPSLTAQTPDDTLKLEITEVWDLEQRITEDTSSHVSYGLARRLSHDPVTKAPPMWIEATILSKILTTTLKENDTLEIGDEASWDPETLINSRVVDGLTQTAATMVKQMDNVGFWNDNGAFDHLRQIMPTPRPSAYGLVEKFW